MRIARKLNVDHEVINRFISVLGSGMLEINNNKFASPGFFILAHNFISEYIDGIFFKKEELLIETLQGIGFSSTGSPISLMRAEQAKSRKEAEQMIEAAKEWQAGDEKARRHVGWAVSEYTATIRKHLERLNTLVIPLLEQNLAIEDEHKIAEGFNMIKFEGDMENALDKYDKLVETLEEELSDWR